MVVATLSPDHKKSKKSKKEKTTPEKVATNAVVAGDMVTTPKKNKKKNKEAVEASPVVTETAVETKEERRERKRKRKAGEAAAVAADDDASAAAAAPKKPKLERDPPQEAPPVMAVAPLTHELPLADVEKAKAAEEGAFEKFRISEPVVTALRARGVTHLFPVQARTFDAVLDGHDLVVRARTGTGKTLSFAIPLVESLLGSGRSGPAPRALCLVPTRELALQVAQEFTRTSAALRVLAVYGGTGYGAQEGALRRGVDVVVGTPGRVLDYVQKGTLATDSLKHVVLDEVDRMLDMGFQEPVEEILTAAYARETRPQTLLWSATLPAWVRITAQRFMAPELREIDLVGQDRVKTSTLVRHLAMRCGWQDRPGAVADVLQAYSGRHGRAMVFCETKREADELTQSLQMETHVMHGDVPQQTRELVLKGFRDGRYKVLVTTDVAARGLDVPEVDLVIQTAPPRDVDSYVHRAGRTGRAGKEGVCVCFYKPQQEWELVKVERHAGFSFSRVGGPSPAELLAAAARDATASLDAVTSQAAARFRQAAQELLAARGAEDALAHALCALAGPAGEIKARSLLNASEGFTTYLFSTSTPMHAKGYVWGSLQRQLPQEVSDKVRGMTFTKDKLGAVFDVPSELDDVVAAGWSDSKLDSLAVAQSLPEMDAPAESPGGWGRGGGFRGVFRGRGGRGRRTSF